MNWAERRALQRAAVYLAMPAGEQPEEFDLADTRLVVLPHPPFPFPLGSAVKRIDLGASEQAFYIHAGGVVARYGWQDLLEVSLSNENFIHWLLRDGRTGQVHVGDAPRPLAGFLRERLTRFEADLTSPESYERDRLRAKYGAERERRQRTGQVLEPYSGVAGINFMIGFSGTVTSSDGYSVTGSTSPNQDGLRFESETVAVTVPFRAIGMLKVDAERGVLNAEIEEKPVVLLLVSTATRDDLQVLKKQRFISFEVHATKTVPISQWAHVLEQLKIADAVPEVGRLESAKLGPQFAPGWIEVLDTTTYWEGVFDSQEAFEFRADTGPALGPRSIIPWSQVNWVRLAPASSLSPTVAKAHSSIIARSIDGSVLYGALTGPKGPGTEMFGLVGSATRSGAEWLEVFQTAGVKLRA